jgi:YD repeat-containing protein
VTGQGANSQLVTVTARASASGATFADTTNERTVRTTWGREAPNAPGAGDPHSVLYPDGRIETHTYEIGEFDGNTRTFTANSSGSHERHTRTEGTQANPEGVENRTLRHVEIRHLYGDVVIYEETDVRTGVGYAVLEWAQHVTDPYWRRISTTRSNGTVEEITHGCCGIEARVAADGTEEGYEYDALHRLTETTRYGAPSGSGAPTVSRSVRHVYDDAGRMIQTLTQAGSLSQTNQTVYDTAGRVMQTVDEQGRVTSYGYAADGLSQTVTNANGSVVETARFRDGRSKHTKLNGDYRQVYDYGVESDGRQRTTVYSGPGGANSPVWQKTWNDMLGRTVRTERPAHGGGVLVQTSEYDALGRLVRSTSTGQPDTLYSYDALGELFHTAHDLNSNGAIDLASDRVQSSYTFYQALGSDKRGQFH